MKYPLYDKEFVEDYGNPNHRDLAQTSVLSF